MKTLMRPLLTLMLLLTAACQKDPDVDHCGWTAPVTADDARKDVLVIGDSISMGYFWHLIPLLPTADVQHHDCNGTNSRNGKAMIEQWLSVRSHFDVVVFNHGIWDNESQADHRTSDFEYENNLRSEARAIKAKATCPIFLLTTHVERASEAGIVHKNQIALRVMTEEGIPVLDTHTFTETLTRTDGTHYTEENYARIADFVHAGITQHCGAL